MRNKLFLSVLTLFVSLFVACSGGDNKPASKRPQAPSFWDQVYSKQDKQDTVVTITTSLGDIELVLFNSTPIHKSNFLKHTRDGFYNGTTFHRVIQGFMIQGGDPNSKDSIPTNDGMGGPGYTIENEISVGFLHRFGAVAAARTGGPQNPEMRSSGSQFYIVENPIGTPALDRQYTVYGQVISGFDVVQTIALVDKDPRDRPIEDVTMEVSLDVRSVDEIKETYKASLKTTAK